MQLKVRRGGDGGEKGRRKGGHQGVRGKEGRILQG